MARWILLVGMMLGLGGWLRNEAPDRIDLAVPPVAIPEVQIMDGADPFPPD